jgi:hypothetical protein
VTVTAASPRPLPPPSTNLRLHTVAPLECFSPRSLLHLLSPSSCRFCLVSGSAPKVLHYGLLSCPPAQRSPLYLYLWSRCPAGQGSLHVFAHCLLLMHHVEYITSMRETWQRGKQTILSPRVYPVCRTISLFVCSGPSSLSMRDFPAFRCTGLIYLTFSHAPCSLYLQGKFSFCYGI